MITLRLPINEINTLYSALEVARDNDHAHGINVEHVETLMDKVKEMTEKDATSWDGYVTNEVNNVLELFLPESKSGNVGIKYNRATAQEGDGEAISEDPNKAEGVSINIVLSFTTPIDISNIDK